MIRRLAVGLGLIVGGSALAFLPIDWIESLANIRPDGGSGEFELGGPIVLIGAGLIQLGRVWYAVASRGDSVREQREGEPTA